MKINRSFILFLFVMCCCTTAKKQKSTHSILLSKPVSQFEILAKDFVSTPLIERDFAISANFDEFIYTLGDYKQSKRVLLSVKKENKG